MERPRKDRERRLTRCSEADRLEDRLLALVYEQIWPLVRQPVKETLSETSARFTCLENSVLSSLERLR